MLEFTLNENFHSSLPLFVDNACSTKLLLLILLGMEDETVKRVFWSGESIFCPTPPHWSTKENGRIALFLGGLNIQRSAAGGGEGVKVVLVVVGKVVVVTREVVVVPRDLVVVPRDLVVVPRDLVVLTGTVDGINSVGPF